jgi:Zn-dependent M28 family amino/carboxypeptidase
VNGDRIYNGALDNASGVATLLELAARLKTGPALRRSVLFLVPTGEEQGLLGSYYFTRRPTIPAKAMVADINFDIVRVYMPWKAYVGYGADESTLEDDVRAVALARGVDVVPDPQPEADLFVRSDQYSFVKAGVPAVFGNVGFKAGSPEDRLLTEWQRDRYHAPSDDLEQPINGDTVRAYNDFTEALVRRVANGTTTPKWKPTSRFRLPNAQPVQ